MGPRQRRLAPSFHSFPWCAGGVRVSPLGFRWIGAGGILFALLCLEACADDTLTTPADTHAPARTTTGAFADGAQVLIEPHWLTLDTIRATDTLAATVLDAEGDTIDDATVDTAGVVTSVGFGSTRVSATHKSATAEATVEVALPLTDREILEIFYEAAGGDGWTDNTNWLSNKDLDEWYGVGAYQGKVSDLSLWKNNLVGTIPPELGTHLPV